MGTYIPPALRENARDAHLAGDQMAQNLTPEEQLQQALRRRRTSDARHAIARILQRDMNPISIPYREGDDDIIDIYLGQGATDADNSSILNLEIRGNAQFPDGPLQNPGGHLHFYNPGRGARMAMGVRIDFYFTPRLRSPHIYGDGPIKFNIRIDPIQDEREPQIRLTLDRGNIGRGTTEIARSSLYDSRRRTLGEFNIKFNEALKKADNGFAVNNNTVRRSNRISNIDSDSLRDQLSYLLDAFTGLEVDLYARFTGGPNQGFQLGGKKSRKTRKVRKNIKIKRKTHRVRKSRKKIKSRKSRKNKRASKSRKNKKSSKSRKSRRRR